MPPTQAKPLRHTGHNQQVDSSLLGPLMFLIYINDIGVNIKSHIQVFEDDMLL